MLTTKEQVKADLGIKGTNLDGDIDAVIAGVSLAFARDCDRVLNGQSLLEYGDEQIDRVERFKLSQAEDSVTLAAYGDSIVSINEVVAATSIAALEAEDLLVEDVDWHRDGSIIERLTAGTLRARPWFYGSGIVRVTYACGYWTGDEGELPEGVQMAPADLTLAARLQAVHEFKNRANFGNRSVQIGSMSIDEVRDGLLEVVKRRLAPYRRLTMAG